MSTRAALIDDNLRVLGQCLAALEGVDEALYARSEPAVLGSSLGAQLRHVLDFYAGFLRQAPEGRIDYDRRERDPRLESSHTLGLARARALCAELPRVAGSLGRGALWIKQEGSDDDGRAPWAASTVERELQVLLSHSVHHLALMAVILHLAGRTLPSDLGMAPSTLRHRESLCAPKATPAGPTDRAACVPCAP